MPDVIRVGIVQDSKYAPVSLPYSYRPIAPIEQADTTKLQAVIADSHKFVEALDAKHTRRVETFKNWKEAQEAQNKAETMRLAPGYIDSIGSILVPSRLEQKSADASEQEQEQAQQEEKAPEDELAGLKF